MNILKTIMIATFAGYTNTRVVASPEATILTQEGLYTQMSLFATKVPILPLINSEKVPIIYPKNT